jgi:hypothetical protein
VTSVSTCDACGRTILAGERTRTYISPKDGPRVVCDLCRDRAERLGWVDPAAPGANVGRGPEPPAAERAASRVERAAARFDASAAARTVAGLIRSLGEPWVSIGAAAGSSSEIRITVAWDLCWYQWGVDLADELRPVFQIDKGGELEQLDRSARQWNASATPEGKLTLGTAGRQRPRQGEPVG